MTTDASENAIGGVLSEERHTLIYVSRRLSAAEYHYSNIKTEAYVIGRLRKFLLRRNLKLITHHEPL